MHAFQREIPDKWLHQTNPYANANLRAIVLFNQLNKNRSLKRFFVRCDCKQTADLDDPDLK